MPRLGGVARDQEAVRRAQRERCVARQFLFAEARQPTLHDVVATLCDVGDDARPEQVAGSDRVAGTDRVTDRVIGVAARLVPRARPAVEHRHELRFGSSQLRTQHVAEQRVPPVPFVRGVQGAQQRARLLEIGQHEPRSLPFEHCVAHRARQFVQHGRPHRELAQRGRQRRKHLVAEILGERVIVAADTLDRLREVRLAA